MKRWVIIGVLLMLFSVGAYPQEYVKAVKLGTIRTDFDFTPEWQYISSDLYLFNADKFADILNKVLAGKKKCIFLHKRPDLTNILITMNLQGLKGYDKITFPLYNFVISRDDQGNMKVNTETNEVIRIIDNYPAPSVEDFITAKVDVKVITKDDQVKVYKLAASQLETIANAVTNPSTAVIKLVGEFGKMIQSAADQKEYHFASTIRIYENENFNQRLHSIVVFVFLPSQMKDDKIKLDLSDLDSALKDTSVVITRKLLSKYVKIKKYPYVVIVNYKSKYIPDVPEEIDFDVLKARESKLSMDLAKGVINKEIYELEKEFLEYLKLYAQFQMDLNNYLLNLENKTTEDFSKFYYYLVRDYWRMKNYYKIVAQARKDNKIYKEEFKPLYDKFLMRVNMHLEQNTDLQKIRDLVGTLYYLENTQEPKIKMDSSSVEGYLAKLYGVPLPKSEENTPVMQVLAKWTKYLEGYLYDHIYSSKFAQLQMLPVNSDSYQKIIEAQREYSLTQCRMCKDSLNSIVESYRRKYREYQLEKAKTEFEQVKGNAKVSMIEITKKVSCIRQKLRDYPGVKPEYLQLIEQDAIKLDDRRQALLASLNKNYLFTSADEIKQVTEDISTNLQNLQTDLESLCKQEPQVCDCTKPWPKPQTDTTAVKKAPQTDTTRIQVDTLKTKPAADTAHIKVKGAEPEKR